VVDETALINALENKEIAGAAVDVWENEPVANDKLKKMENVIASPHIGASSKEAQSRCVFDLIENIFEFYGY
jgi:D-3-phosphoglycerate dehydrogenase